MRTIPASLSSINTKSLTSSSEPATATQVHCTLENAARQAATDVNPQGRPNTNIAIICALPLEYDALRATLDGRPQIFSTEDDSWYWIGSLAGEEVAIALLTEFGSRDAALAVRTLEKVCHNLKLVILLGACAGIPSPQPPATSVYLGDVILATAVLAYARGARQNSAGLELKSIAPQDARGRIRHLLRILRTEEESEDLANESRKEAHRLQRHLRQEQNRYHHPGQDLLFDAAYHHLHYQECPTNICDADKPRFCDAVQSTTCQTLGCDMTQVTRKKEASLDGQVHFCLHPGVFASADLIMRNPMVRDDLAAQHKILAFDMEASGIWDLNRNVMVIKGVSDYGDSHKSHEWQSLAALHAACVTKRIVGTFFSGGI